MQGGPVDCQGYNARDAIVVGDDDVGPQMNMLGVMNAAAVEDWENLQCSGAARARNAISLHCRRCHARAVCPSLPPPPPQNFLPADKLF